ncbi:MAG: hypothetical protein KKC76_15205 [Proteobacteria bacterium]|nr:hypothetical protein [Pseudomonadota bacterium]MBU4297683.1 hypothetical protein [Pseudomonadota bacterium]MCG2746453.1 hypothetical protein [Desulfobulbaceae bacterium]
MKVRGVGCITRWGKDFRINAFAKPKQLQTTTGGIKLKEYSCSSTRNQDNGLQMIHSHAMTTPLTTEHDRPDSGRYQKQDKQNENKITFFHGQQLDGLGKNPLPTAADLIMICIFSLAIIL